MSGWGGGGGGSLTARKQPGQRFFLFSFSPQLILQFTEGVQWFYYRVNYIVYFSKDRGGPTFLGGGGVQGPSVNFYRNPFSIQPIKGHRGSSARLFTIGM